MVVNEDTVELSPNKLANQGMAYSKRLHRHVPRLTNTHGAKFQVWTQVRGLVSTEKVTLLFIFLQVFDRLYTLHALCAAALFGAHRGTLIRLSIWPNQ